MISPPRFLSLLSFIGLYDKIDKDKYASYGIYRYFDRNENVTVYDLLLKMIVNDMESYHLWGIE